MNFSVLSGTPTASQVGTYSGISISASDGTNRTTLPSFSIAVNASGSSSGSATLSWTPPTTNTNGTSLTNLAGYRIYYGTSSSSLNRTIQVANAGVTRYVVPDLSAGFGEVVEVMLAKERKQRYQTPDALILDLMCLLNDEPPKLARRGGKQRAVLEELAELEAEHEPEDEEPDRPNRPKKRRTRGAKSVLWLAVLGSLLAISVILNVVLLLFRH